MIKVVVQLYKAFFIHKTHACLDNVRYDGHIFILYLSHIND